MSVIIAIHGRQILDSRGNPTIEVDVDLGRRLVRPRRGAQRRQHRRARSLGAARRRQRKFLGKGGRQAVDNVNDKIAEELVGMDALDQAGLDRRMIELDGTENKKNLGANAILGVSLAVAHAAAEFCGLPLFRYLGGAAHGCCRRR